ncbi:MAG: GNAT family N-acetyltransferase [Chloroflexota bacterium]|nr:GNAT family N-acetyltransferase [Chloroflexota bacterium]
MRYARGVVLHPKRAADLEAIIAVHEAVARAAYAHIFSPEQGFPREETRRRWQTYTGGLVVAEDDGQVIGFAAFDERELHALYVLPAYWGQGVGHRLLAAAGPVWELWVLRDNARARRFYERHGWRPDGAAVPAGAVEVRYRRVVPNESRAGVDEGALLSPGGRAGQYHMA